MHADDRTAIPVATLVARNPSIDWDTVTDIILGCANQAGHDNRNVALMPTLLAGLPVGVSNSTVNRLRGSGLDAIGTAAQAIQSGRLTDLSRISLLSGLKTLPVSYQF